MIKFLLGLLFFCVTISSFSQQKSFQEEVLNYFQLNGTEKQYDTAIDQMFVLLKNQYGNQQVPENVWKDLQKEKSIMLQDIKERLVPAYQVNFTKNDIQELIVFYSSETGKQLVNDPTGLSETQKTKYSDFLNSTIGQKVRSQGSRIGQMVTEVSETWSRSLYENIVEKLGAKGYRHP